MLGGGDLYSLAFDIEPYARIDIHVDVSDPDESEPGNEVAAPVFVKHAEARDEQENNCYVMAETILASEQIKELALV